MLEQVDLKEANARIVQLERIVCIKQELLDHIYIRHDNLKLMYAQALKTCHRRKREVEGTGRIILELQNKVRDLETSVTDLRDTQQNTKQA